MTKNYYVNMPHNKRIFRFLNKLVWLRYISSYEIMSPKVVRVYLVYGRNMLPPYRYSKLLCRQSFRAYISYKQLYLLLKHDYGVVYILSTSLGLLTHYEAIEARIGGEIICVLYS